MTERVELTEAEQEALWEAIERAFLDTTTYSREVEDGINHSVEAIIAARLESADRKLDMALRMHEVQLDRADRERDRAEQAEAALADLRAGIEALADDWEDEGRGLGAAIDALGAASDLRALLAEGGADHG